MVDWNNLTPPAAPPKKELLSAFLIAALFATAIVLIPFGGIWNSPTRLALAGIATLVLAILTFTVKRIRSVTAVALVLLVWQTVIAVDQSHLPEAFRGLAPHRIHDLSSSLKLLVLRFGMLAPAVLVTLILCWLMPDARKRFREHFLFGDWNGGTPRLGARIALSVSHLRPIFTSSQHFDLTGNWDLRRDVDSSNVFRHRSTFVLIDPGLLRSADRIRRSDETAISRTGVARSSAAVNLLQRRCVV